MKGEIAIGKGSRLPLVISTFTKLIALLKSKKLNKIIINNTFSYSNLLTFLLD